MYKVEIEALPLETYSPEIITCNIWYISIYLNRSINLTVILYFYSLYFSINTYELTKCKLADIPYVTGLIR